jgi:hypothetical protein
MTVPFQVFLILMCILVFFTMPWWPWGATALAGAVGLVAHLADDLDSNK